ncbi:MAG: hypothetical protein J0M12_07195 [Deltaproteobacteria bacterium]|nr:hypothetical protein [Deltaproteobacteria bacterium]
MASTIRAKVDTELTRRVGKWFTVREIQEKLRINPATLKPLLMKYARENLLRRRHVKGTARSVQFSPAANSRSSFEALISRNMPYRNFSPTSVIFGGKRSIKAPTRSSKARRAAVRTFTKRSR